MSIINSKDDNNILPSTVVLCITTHGLIIPSNDKTQYVKNFQFNGKTEKSKMVYISATSIGVANYCDYVDSNKITKLIQENMDMIKVPTSSSKKKSLWDAFSTIFKKKNTPSHTPIKGTDETSPTNEFAVSLAEKLKNEIYKTNITKTNIDKYMAESALLEVPVSPEYLDYVQSYNKSYDVKLINDGDTFYNKFYSVSVDEYNEYENDFKIKIILDNTDTIDVIKLLQIKPHKNQYSVYLKDIVDFLSNNGVTKIIIFDFTCNSFHNKSSNIDMTSRYNRLLKRKSSIVYGKNIKPKQRKQTIKRQRTISPSSTISPTKQNTKKYKTIK
jgi:hypothetical protein